MAENKQAEQDELNTGIANEAPDEAQLEAAESMEQAAAEGTADDALAAELEQAKEQLAEAKEQVLRAAAEAQNARRRAEKEVESAHKFGQEKLITELLPVVDNLERALALADRDNADNQAFLEGIDLTHKSFLDALRKFSIEAIDPHGEPFDPQLHQAMTMVESPDAEPNTVIDVMAKGYSIHGRLLRPAMVVVSKAVAAEQGSIDEQA